MVRQAQHKRTRHSLLCHPSSTVTGIQAVTVELVVHEASILVSYEIDHRGTLCLPDHEGRRQDDLWRRTCFELFAKRPDIAGYLEYNFAPFEAWAAYAFDGYRTGMKPAEVDAPYLVDGRYDERADEIDHFFEYSAVVRRNGPLVSADVQVGLSAVIEETDGNKSYWALAHPDGPPDFHDPACFVLELSVP